VNNINIKLHSLQFKILEKLVTTESARFNDLLLEEIESEHMNYHLKKLLEFGFVTKADDKYILTDAGKDYSNLLDDQVTIIEKQPKTSVLINGIRIREDTGEIEYLLSKRLRQPYLNKVGRLTGKVRFGETLEEAAARELYEETGLAAKTIVLEEIHHKMRYREDGEFVQDVLFYIFFMKDFYGAFIERTEFQENLWVTKREFEKGDFDTYKDIVFWERTEPRQLVYTENVKLADGF